MKAANAAALKEWAVVTRALRDGLQVFLLRKGGVAEEAGEFRLQEPEFFLFPTYEHPTAADLAPSRAGWIEDARASAPPAGSIDFDVYARADAVLRVADASRLRKVLPFTIWSEAFLEKRLAYKPESPLHLVFLRCYRAPRPRRAADLAEYAGCASWVSLKEPLPTAGFYPVFSPEVFEAEKRKVTEALNA